ncbi:sugar kinase [Leifsonia shinshuensis]
MSLDTLVALRTGPVVTFGETMAMFASESPGPLLHCRSMTLGIGGSESNVAIALRRLETEAAWIGRVGEDSLGDLVLRELRAEGVTTIGIRDARVPTGLMIKERRSERDTKVWYYRQDNAGSRLSPGDLDADLIRSSSLLHVTGITPALSPSARDATFAAIDIARESRVPVSFDLNYRGRLWSHDDARAVYRRIIAQSDLVFAGDDEAAIAVGRADTSLQLAHRIADLGPSHAVVKRGALGAVAVASGVEYEQAAIPIVPVDTVGAGDGFVAGYLSEHLLGAGVQACLLTAVTVGAHVCLVAGDWEGLPSRKDLDGIVSAEPVSR